ncbi:MAG: response regulator [Deltaproteobacteria bacterium]|nr:response regulator [Deltaproteobacteria bacterium]
MTLEIKRPLVLVIDDEASVRSSIGNFLDDFDYRVLQAETGLLGIDIVKRERPDVVLVDLRLPEMDGLDVLKVIHRISADTPSIVISGTGVIGDVVEALRLGAWDYLIKPIEDMSVLLYSVERVLERARLIQQNRAYQEHLEREVAKRTQELIQANQELKESVQKYQLLAENLKDVVLALSPEGLITYCSPAVMEFAGYRPDEVVGTHVSNYFADSYQRARTLKLFEQATSASVPQQIESLEFSIQRKNGEALPVEITIKTVTKNDQIVSFQCVMRDISERRRSEEESRWKSEALEQSLDGIAIADQAGVLRFVNTAWAVMHGYQKEEIRQKNIEMFYSREQESLDIEGLINEVDVAGGYKGNLNHVRKNGTVFTVRMSKTAIRNADGEVIGSVSIARDITEEIRLEAQLRHAQRMESVGRLAGGIAHDFNNLLSPILGYAELLLGEFSPSDPRYEDLQEIMGASSRAKILTRQLLAFSRKQVLTMQKVDLNRVITDFQGILRRTIRETIEIVTDLSSSLGTIRADISQLEQIIMNLAINAQDAMPQGGRLTIGTKDITLDDLSSEIQPGLKKGLYVLLEVRDTGYGIDARVMKNIFDPFFTTKEKGEGTGLGLSTVHGIVEQHGGAIAVASEPGKGASFKVLFPCVDVQARETISTPLPKEVKGGSETVLVVEDDESVRNVVCSILSKHGYRVLKATSPRDCGELIDRNDHSIDLLITDIVMPEKNGWELYRHLVSIWPRLKVLYMSGYTDDVIAHHHVEEKESDFIQKPFTVQTLTAKVREVLER